jgi:signal transduction histidine kinase
MNHPNASRWKVLILLLTVLISIYILRDLLLFMKSPYLGIYGELDSKGYRIEKIINLKSSEPLGIGMHIQTLGGISIEDWLRSILRIRHGTKPSWASEKPLELEVRDEMNISKTILVFPRHPSMEDLFKGPFWLWSLSIFILFCGVYLLFRYPDQRRVRILSILILVSALSIFNKSGRHLLLQISENLPLILTIRLGSLCVIFSSWLYLILIFLEKRRNLRISTWIPWMIYGLPPIAASMAFLSGWNRSLSGIEHAYRLLYLIAGAVVFFTSGVLWWAYRKTKDAVLKAQLKWILWGHILGMSPYILLYSLPKALIGLSLISYSVSILFFPLILFSYLFAFYRYRLMDVDRVIHGSLVYGISVILMLSVYFLILSFFLHRMTEPSGRETWFRADLLLIFAAVLAFNPLKNLVQGGIDRALFPERLGLPLLLIEGSNRLTRSSHMDEITDFLLKELPNHIAIEKAALILQQQFKEGWEFHENPEGWIETNREMISSFDLLSKETLPRFWDTLSEDETAGKTNPLTFLKSQGVAILFPMNSGDDLWGFYLLGDKTTHRLLSSEEIHVVSTLCTQAAHMVGNARLMEGLQRTNRSLVELSHRLMQAERMADMGEGAATLAHELKNPLGIVRGSAEILLKETDPSKKNEILGFILDEVDRLTGIVDEFLQFARMSPPTKSKTDLNDLVRSAAFLWESGRKSTVPISIKFQLDNKTGKVSLDSRQIYQVLLNIFTNAEEAMPEGGEIFISTGIDVEGGQSWISIKDTGKGIPQEHLRQVYNRFFTTKDSGLGLGLTVVKKVMEAHRGFVRIESSVGNGTKVALLFSITI